MRPKEKAPASCGRFTFTGVCSAGLSVAALRHGVHAADECLGRAARRRARGAAHAWALRDPGLGRRDRTRVARVADAPAGVARVVVAHAATLVALLALVALAAVT